MYVSKISVRFGGTFTTRPYENIKCEMEQEIVVSEGDDWEIAAASAWQDVLAQVRSVVEAERAARWND